MDKNINKLVSGYEEGVDLPNYKHEYMFYYLKISPSYWLAHRVIKLGEVIPANELPKDFEKVLDTYKKLGDVYQIEFYEWWLGGAKNAFATNKKKLLWLGVDPSKTEEQIRKDFELFLSKLESKKQSKQQDKIVLEVNKVRLVSLHHRHDLVHERAWRAGKYWQKEPLWKLIRWGQYPSERRKEVRINTKKKSSNVEVRSYLTMLASKNLKLALNTAEHAARGIFPSQDPIDTALDFDYERIADLEATYDWDYEKITAFKKSRKDYMKYLSPAHGNKKARKKMPKASFDEVLQKE
ncbi:MAG: hypothetical protein K9J28_09790 [Sulfuritalea sp.]|nr:hypothetical protein [Sulfuritalea sp.]